MRHVIPLLPALSRPCLRGAATRDGRIAERATPMRTWRTRLNLSRWSSMPCCRPYEVGTSRQDKVREARPPRPAPQASLRFSGRLQLRPALDDPQRPRTPRTPLQMPGKGVRTIQVRSNPSNAGTKQSASQEPGNLGNETPPGLRLWPLALRSARRRHHTTISEPAHAGPARQGTRSR